MKNRLPILLLAAAVLSGKAHAQDVHFSQFFENSALRNPALTGIFTGDYKAGVNYRNQWSSFAVPFQTALVTAETKALLRESTGDYLSFGLTALHDKAGSIDFTGTSVYGAANYNKALGSESLIYLSIGLCGGYIQRSFDVSKMRFASQFSGGSTIEGMPAGEMQNVGSLHHWDASAGVSLSGALTERASFYAGIAGYHLSQPTESFNQETMIRLTTRWSASAGLSARLTHGYGLTAHLNYQYQQPYRELIGGLLVSRTMQEVDLLNSKKVVLSAGLMYRYQDAIIPMMKVDYDSWSLTMSYDVAVSSRRMYLSGFAGYEATFAIRGNYRHKESNLKCPHFELADIDEYW